MLNSLKKSIEKLPIKNQYEIFTILKNDHPDDLTENSNGSFINLSIVSDTTIAKIKKHIDFCENQKKIIESGEDEKNDLMKLHF